MIDNRKGKFAAVLRKKMPDVFFNVASDPAALIKALEQVRPGHRVYKNVAGDFSILLIEDDSGRDLGYVDLLFAETEYWDDANE